MKIVSFIIVGTLLYLVLVALVILFQFIRGTFKDYRNKFTESILFILVASEYLFLSYVVYLQMIRPYVLEPNIGFHRNYGSNLCINPTINYLLMVVYFLICVSSFRHTAPLIKTNIKKFIVTTAISYTATSIVAPGIFMIILYVFPYDSVRNIKDTLGLVGFVLFTLLFIFLISQFRIDKEDRLKTIFLTFIPLFLIYFLFLYTQWRIDHLGGKYGFYVNSLGGAG